MQTVEVDGEESGGRRLFSPGTRGASLTNSQYPTKQYYHLHLRSRPDVQSILPSYKNAVDNLVFYVSCILRVFIWPRMGLSISGKKTVSGTFPFTLAFLSPTQDLKISVSFSFTVACYRN